jgi:hypothetical protein
MRNLPDQLLVDVAWIGTGRPSAEPVRNLVGIVTAVARS